MFNFLWDSFFTYGQIWIRILFKMIQISKDYLIYPVFYWQPDIT